MRKTSYLKQLYSCYFAKPATDRALFRTAAQFEFRSIVEVGIVSIERTVRLIEIAHRYCELPLEYCGIDLFEAQTRASGNVGLKYAHVELKKTGAKIKLMPGDPYACLSRSANLLSGTDLLIIGKNVDQDSMARSWFYLPRMLHDESLILVEDPQSGVFEELDYDAVMARSEESLNQGSWKSARAA